MNSGIGLYVAAQESQLGCLRVLVDAGADLNTRLDSTGITPLAVGAMMGRLDVLSLLIGAGADVNMPASDGTSVLYLCRCAEQIEAVEMLVAAGMFC